MRQNYTCIGASIDIDGIALVRFNLVGTNFLIFKTLTYLKKDANYDRALSGILELAAIETGEPIQTIDVLSNFPSGLKNNIINNHKSQYTIRVKTTPVSDEKQNMILNLINIMNQDRILIKGEDLSAYKAIEELTQTNKKKLKDIYEGNSTLSHTLEAILHSVSWLEGQMIKHRMI